ncbi:putative flagellin protein, C-terminus [Parvibaculum lavamentivorans DS-1]|uniref:Flagellin n=1 Tax=Parvibaculum lavamentivorans (strain DS-1 / DSM 13023 / NCIMB 13966) TaxID=402881 RepID=A7HW77_PARL1|nr:flagellin [Parvibaculum lavamentivorans]ABS64160.1 putative flagellin protein, C-terminus [Parvibaculum lavamentivorans DS-1]
MGDITINSAVRTNLETLQSTAKMMAQTQNRLASGLKVSSALDNPQSFFTAAGLNARASDLSALQDSMSLGVQTLKAADEGIKSIQKLVDQAKSVANQALQAKATTTTLTTTAAPDADTDYSASGASATFTVALGDASADTITLDQDYGSLAAMVSDINDQLSAASAGVTAEVSGTGVTFKAVSGEDITIAGADSGDFGSTLSSDNGETLTEARATYVTDFNGLRDQIDQIANDASFNGINLLKGDTLTVNFNEDSTSKLDITGVTMTVGDDLGIDEADFSTNADIETAVAGLNTATATLRAQASTFGANLSVVQNRQDFTSNMISVLETGSGNLTLADTNEEAANLLALQTRQSLAQTSLSLATQAEQSVLSLLR